MKPCCCIPGLYVANCAHTVDSKDRFFLPRQPHELTYPSRIGCLCGVARLARQILSSRIVVAHSPVGPSLRERYFDRTEEGTGLRTILRSLHADRGRTLESTDRKFSKGGSCSLLFLEPFCHAVLVNYYPPRHACMRDFFSLGRVQHNVRSTMKLGTFFASSSAFIGHGGGRLA